MKKNDRHSVARLPSGFRDLPPADMAARNWMMESVCRVYESHGFTPLDTSPVEFLQTLMAGHDEGTGKQIYSLFKDELPTPERTLALRFELTASLARFLAQNRETIHMPFKRYQSGYVWRGERPQRGRFRQFLQFDVDTVGVADVAADAEILEVIYRSMEALGIGGFEIRLSSRNLLAGLAGTLGLETSEDKSTFFRILDKLDKIGGERLLQLLSASPDEQKDGMSFSMKKLSIVDQVLSLEGDNEMILEEMGRIASGPPETKKGIDELQEVLGFWGRTGIKHPEFLRIVPHLARGLDYYTGPIFETFVTKQEKIGSVMGGGRYDGLIGRFLGKELPAVGVSMGVDRLLVALESLSLLPRAISKCQVLVAVLGEEDRKRMYGVAAQLRTMGIAAELYLGSKLAFREQIKYASSLGIPWLLIQGENEQEKGVVALRNLGTRTQEELRMEDAVTKLDASA